MIVYKITNKINNKIYIGITTKPLEERWKRHCYDAENFHDDFLFHKAIRKYGKENFNVEIIDSASSLEELKQKEIFYINYYNSYAGESDHGYNLTYGGDLNLHLKGENSPCSKNLDIQRWQIIDLLKNSNLTYSQIMEETHYQGKEKIIDMINRGLNFHQEDLDYPIRKNAKSISKSGVNNPSAHDKETILQIINLLENTNKSQSEIAYICNVHYNTVNNINNCKYWTELHNYKKNIRKERK